MGLLNEKKIIFILVLCMYSTTRNRVKAEGCSAMSAKLRSLRRETVCQYDTKRYPFLELAREILEVEAGSLPDLDSVHLSEMGKDRHVDGSGNTLNKLQAIWNSNRCRIDNDFHQNKGEVAPNYEKLDETYHNFVKEVIGPQMGGGTIQYQRAPTLRVYTPSLTAMGKMHNDCNYNHQPSEINFWLPLTNVFGSNTMWVESEENKGDFHPLTMKYGEYVRFYGNKCRHYTIPNDSSKTRVSLDFRAGKKYFAFYSGIIFLKYRGDCLIKGHLDKVTQQPCQNIYPEFLNYLLENFRCILFSNCFIFTVSVASGGHDPSFRKGVRRGVKARFQNVFDVGGFYVECDSEKHFDNSDEIISTSSCSSSSAAIESQQDDEVGKDNVHLKMQEAESSQLNSNFQNEQQLQELRDNDEKGIEEVEIIEKAKAKSVRSRTATRTSRRAAGTVEIQRGIGMV